MRALLFLALLSTGSCADAAEDPAPAVVSAEPAVYGYRIVREYPHDPGAFTQGLFWLDGHLYESTGQIGASTIRKVRLADGRVLQSTDIPEGLFGEGIVNWGDEIISITWRDGVGFRWDRATLQKKSEFRYGGEGWGLAQDGENLIVSTGSHILYFVNPETMMPRRQIAVTARGRPVPRLNELEYVKGEIWANVWLTGLIARIDPASGNVRGWVDLSDLAARMSGGDTDKVLNGIAYDAATDRLFITGKDWRSLFEIEILPPKQ